MDSGRQNKVPITRLSKFFDDEDFGLEIDFGREYVEGDLNMTVVLYSINIEKTDTDDVYKEVKSQDMRFFPPVELKVNLEIDASENSTYGPGGRLRYRDYGDMTFNIYDKQLKEKGTDIKYGDFIGYMVDEDTMKFWVVVDDGKIFSDNEHTIFGYKGATRTVKCTVADKNEFEGI
tara:strand:- start:22390 stop:22917 length:528 start_codon:yes stop_codon:yes gene_type:complete